MLGIDLVKIILKEYLILYHITRYKKLGAASTMTITQEKYVDEISDKFPPGIRTKNWFHLIWAIINPVDWLEFMQERYGDTFSFHGFGGFPEQVITSHPQAIQEIFMADSNLFTSGEGSQSLEPIVGMNSLLLQDGERHLQKRKLLLPSFHGERMRAYGQTMSEIAEQVMSKLKVKEKFIARPVMQEISLNIILRSVFGLNEGERYEEIRKILSEMLDSFNNPLSVSFLFFKSLRVDLGSLTPWGNFLRKREKLNQLLYQEIRLRRAQEASLGEDILSLLLSVRDENGQGMSDEELRDELMTMLFAGHETTASALAWALYWIHYVPEVRQKLLQELNSIDIPNTDPIEITKLPYLNAVCSETLRISPIAFFTLGRLLRAPMRLMNYQIPQGIMLVPSIYLTHRRRDLYPEPNKFRPERFLERQFSPYEYIPFGGGNRRCLGAAFAMFELKLVLATLLSQYSFTLLENRPLKPVRRGITFTAPGGVPLMLNDKR